MQCSIKTLISFLQKMMLKCFLPAILSLRELREMDMQISCAGQPTVYLPFLLSVFLSQLQKGVMNSESLERLLGFKGANLSFDSIKRREALYVMSKIQRKVYCMSDT